MLEIAPPKPLLLPFEKVYELYGQRVFRFCLLQVGGDRPLAEDLSSEALMAAYRAYERVSPDAETVHVWLFRIARNVITDHRRRETRRRLLLQKVGREPQAVEDVEEISASRAEFEEMVGVLRQMKERDRRVIALRVAGGLTLREIAHVLGVPENTAAAISRRALERFRALSGGVS
jgi:RNA polymerase sigma-70 factor (ECF subfamily)